MLGSYKLQGLRIAKTEMEYKDRVIRFWIIVPKGCENIASEFKASIASFYVDFEVSVKCKEED